MVNNEQLNLFVELCTKRDDGLLSWQEVADKMNAMCDENFGSDKYRKDWSSFKQGIEYARVNSGNSELDELEERIFELKKEKTKLSDQRTEYNKLARHEARAEQFYELMLNEISQLHNSKPMIYMPNHLYDKTDEYTEGVLMLSDWHYGLFTRNYWNNFDNEEFAKRVNHLVKKAVQYGKKNNIQKLHVFGLGDWVNGLIHVTTRISNTEDSGKQTRVVTETLGEILSILANEFKQIELYFVRGNHDRITPNKNDEIAQESFADFIPWYLKLRLKEFENINFVKNTIDDEIASGYVCGHLVYAVHGHRDKIDSVVQNLSLMTKEVPEYILMGHIHHLYERDVQGVEVIVNSSLSGTDTYAKEIRKTSKPSQKMLIFNEKEGRIDTKNIRLDVLN